MRARTGTWCTLLETRFAGKGPTLATKMLTAALAPNTVCRTAPCASRRLTSHTPACHGCLARRWGQPRHRRHHHLRRQKTETLRRSPSRSHPRLSRRPFPLAAAFPSLFLRTKSVQTTRCWRKAGSRPVSWAAARSARKSRLPTSRAGARATLRVFAPRLNPVFRLARSVASSTRPLPVHRKLSTVVCSRRVARRLSSNRGTSHCRPSR